MRDETIALHSGFDADPATRAVAVLKERVANQALAAAMRGQFRMVR